MSGERERRDVRADGFWEFPITKGRRVCVPINDSLMDYGINFICGDSRAHVGCSKVEHLAAELTNGIVRIYEIRRKKLTRQAVRILSISSGARIRGGLPRVRISETGAPERHVSG